MNVLTQEEMLRKAFMMQPVMADNKKADPLLDSVNKNDKDAKYDSGKALAFAAQDLKIKAAAIVQGWTETDDLDEGENLADRLLATMSGAVDDGSESEEYSEDEKGELDMLAEYVGRYMMKHGVSQEDCNAILVDGDNAAAERVRDLLASELPDGDGAEDDIRGFAFDDESEESLFDSAADIVLDASVRKMKKHMVHGRAVRSLVKIRKLSTKTQRTAAQKRAQKAMQRAAHKASNIKKAIRSRMKGHKLGLY